MRMTIAATSLLVLCCSSGSAGPGTGNTGGASQATDGGGQGSINGVGGPGQVDCATAPDQVGCPCANAQQVRSCQVGKCPGQQTCVSSGSTEFFSNTWGPCSASLLPSAVCSTADGAGGGGGMSGDGTGGRGMTDDGKGGSDTTGDGKGGSGTTGDGPLPSLCTNDTINNEPEILVAYAPANGQSVGATGQIKVWINDEGAPFISPGEKLDPNTGAIAIPGDRTAKAPDGYLWEPALYIAPQTAENGGTPHFPQMIKGWYNYPGRGKTAGFTGASIEPIPGNPRLPEKYTAEDIWDVSALGLAPGKYIGEFVIWDGDTDRAVGCISIVITP